MEEHKCLNSELWHACAGPLVSLPAVGSRVVYFPQGHSEQVCAQAHHARESYMSSSSLAVKLKPPIILCKYSSKTPKKSPLFTLIFGEFLLQVAASTNKEMESQIPNYPNLPPQLICQLHNVTMHVSLGPWNTFSLRLSNLSFVFHYCVISLLSG